MTERQNDRQSDCYNPLMLVYKLYCTLQVKQLHVLCSGTSLARSTGD